MRLRMIVLINKDLLMPELMYNKPVHYNESIVVYPVTMEHVLAFNALKSSMENVMSSLMYEEGVVQNEMEWKAAFLQSLAIQINSASNLTVRFLEVDMKKGTLSVEAILTWTHPIGTVGTVSSTMTIIMEEYED